MCKIFSIVGIPATGERKAFELLYAAIPAMTSSDRDGFGYAAYLPRSHRILMERWLDPKMAFVHRPESNGPEKLQPFLVGQKHLYQRTGGRRTKTEPVTTLTAHARHSTSGGVCLENVHPFHRTTPSGTHITLIHNGVISNERELSLEGSRGCDSAGIMNMYADARVDEDVNNITKATERLSGSYACAVIGLPEVGNAYIDIFRHTSDLTMTEVAEVGLVWCTKREIVEKAAEAAKCTILGSWEMQEHVMLRLDAVTGDLIGSSKFDTYSYKSNYANGYQGGYQGGVGGANWKSERHMHSREDSDDGIAGMYGHYTGRHATGGSAPASDVSSVPRASSSSRNKVTSIDGPTSSKSIRVASAEYEEVTAWLEIEGKTEKKPKATPVGEPPPSEADMTAWAGLV